MNLDKNFEDHKQWVHGARQHLFGDPGETREDAANFMQSHLEYYGRDDLYFNPLAIVHFEGRNEFVIELLSRDVSDLPEDTVAFWLDKLQSLDRKSET